MGRRRRRRRRRRWRRRLVFDTVTLYKIHLKESGGYRVTHASRIRKLCHGYLPDDNTTL
jgi:hypothetical protein